MLKISAIKNSTDDATNDATNDANKTVTLLLEGQVTGQWVKLLRKMCDLRLKQNARITVDLQNVSFADRDGIALLRSLTERRVEILNALPFIAEQIKKSQAE